MTGNAGATYCFANFVDDVATFEPGEYIAIDVEFRDAFMNLLDLTKLRYSLYFSIDGPLSDNCFDVFDLHPPERFGHTTLFERCVLFGDFFGYVAMNGTRISNDVLRFKMIPGTSGLYFFIYFVQCISSNFMRMVHMLLCIDE